MKPSDPGIRVNVGSSGSGKTFEVKRQVFAAVRSGMPVIVVDGTAEWTEVPEDLRPVSIGVTDTKDRSGVAHARAMIDKGARLVIVQPAQLERAGNEAFEWLIERGPRPPTTRGLAIPEAHMILPNVAPTALPSATARVILQWRHFNCALWLDSQRFALLSQTAVNQAREVRLYAIGGETDLRRVKEYGDAHLVACVQRAAGLLRDAIEAGTPERGAGWHVRILMTPLPPYRLRRESPGGAVELDGQ